jgi:hypothetical protein
MHMESEQNFIFTQDSEDPYIYVCDLEPGYYRFRVCSNNTEKSGNVVYEWVEKGEDNVLEITVIPQVCLD